MRRTAQGRQDDELAERCGEDRRRLGHRLKNRVDIVDAKSAREGVAVEGRSGGVRIRISPTRFSTWLSGGGDEIGVIDAWLIGKIT